MNSLKNQLIRLGYQDPSLRKHIRPVLDKVTAKTAMMSKDKILQKYAAEMLRHLPDPDRVKDDSMLTARSFIWQSDHALAPNILGAKVSVLDYDQGPVVQVKILKGAMATPVYDSNEEYLPNIVHNLDDDGVAKPPVRDMASKVQNYIDLL